METIIKHKFFKGTFVVTFLACFAISCGDEDSEKFDAISLQMGPEYIVEVQNFSAPGMDEAIINHSAGTITLVFPCGTDVSALAPQIGLAQGATVSPGGSAGLDLSAPKEYTIVNGNIFKKYRVSADVRCVTGFLSHATNAAAILDDDEKAYADWFFDYYADEVVEFVSFEDIKSGEVDLSNFKTLTWYLDGDENEQFVMPEIALDADVLSKVTDFYKRGGNLYLLGYAGQYLIEMGRIPEDKYFIEIGGGGGFENGDTWGIGTSILEKDESGHPIYSDIQLTVNGTRKTFPVIGAGWRENHNYVFVRIPEVYGLANDNALAYEKFNQENVTKWLGVWDGIGDYFMVGIMELLPKDEFQGRAIFQGIGGIEWNQNKEGAVNPSGANSHRENIEKLAKNSIGYLSVN